MTRRQAERYHFLLQALQKHGMCSVDLDQLLRCQRTLHRWSEEECNGTIQRDDETGIPYRYHVSQYGDIHKAGRVADREAGALKRIAAVLAPHAAKEYTAETCPGQPCGSDCDHKTPGLTFYHQTDPRGCCLYVIRPGDVPEGKDVSAYYTNGIAVCID